MATVTYMDVLRDWANLAHLDYDNLLTDDQETFRTSFNRHSRRIHMATDWPDSVTIEEWDNGTATDTFPVSFGTNLGEVLAVWDKDPRVDQTGDVLQYYVDRENLYVKNHVALSSIWVKYTTTPTQVAYGSTTGTVPLGWQWYILYSCLADWYGADDPQNAERYRAMAAEALDDEIELIERRVGQSPDQTVSTYPNGIKY